MKYFEILQWVDRLMIDSLPTRFFYAKAIWQELIPILLTEKHWLPVTMQAYGRIPEFLSKEHNSQIFDWESKVFEDYFNKKPGKVLVGACGAGREMKLLADKGYSIAGFDPCLEYIAGAKEILTQKQILALEVKDYESFLTDGESIEKHSPYDLGILGWGSIVHIAENKQRLAIMRKFRELVPFGYMLISWISQPQMQEQRKKIHKLFSPLASVRRKSKNHYDTHLGMIHLFNEAEIKNLVRESGFEIVKLENTLTRNYALLK